METLFIETVHISKFLLSITTSPQGDGNLTSVRHKTCFLKTFHNHFPARGWKQQGHNSSKFHQLGNLENPSSNHAVYLRTKPLKPTELMIDAHFQTLTTFPPRNFQREAIAKLLHRQGILLRAPTGSGKTFCFYSTQ